MNRDYSPGLHDPYWYEDLVGLRLAMKVLDPESGVRSVVLQAPGFNSIDDVVVSRLDGSQECYQVKHSRTGTPLSNASLLSENKGKCLLQSLVEGWSEAKARGRQCDVRLLSNRAGDHDRSGPSLVEMWFAIKNSLEGVSTLAGIKIAEPFSETWDRWLRVLKPFGDETAIGFLESLHLDLAQPKEEQLESEILESLAVALGIDRDRAKPLLISLFAELRIWATSRRGAHAEITAEALFAAMQLPGESIPGDHTFAPPAPFFESRSGMLSELETSLLGDSSPVHFLVGSPGSGKTSLVSALASRRDTCIDLRYHAFRPLAPGIPPDGDLRRTARADALWGDLLCQLRQKFFRGRLFECKVPVRNDLIANDTELLREHVLRLASQLASERGRPTIIAIDGLDHAVRAQRLAPHQLGNGPSLVETLVAPSQCPNGIIFLLAGQPPENMYPSWLRRTNVAVRFWDMPGVDIDDTILLLQNHVTWISETPVDVLARLIQDHAGSNTLATVFAVQELHPSMRVAEYGRHLESRSLGPDLDGYYERIWKSAFTAKGSPAAETALAATLALSTVRLTGELLTSIFPGIALGTDDWKSLLLGLNPLVVEYSDGFGVLHNDVRVFLERVAEDQGEIRDVALQIATFHQANKGTIGRHRDLFRLLAIGDDLVSAATATTTEWVLEALALDRPTEEIREQCGATIRALCKTQADIDWRTIHSVALGLATARQFEMNVFNRVIEPTSGDSSSFLASECRAVNTEEWTTQLLLGVLEDVATLVNSDQTDRATALLGRWFEGLTPPVVMKLCEHGDETTDDHSGFDRQETQALLETWGRYAHLSPLEPPQDMNDDEGGAWAHYYGGWIKEGAEKSSYCWESTLEHVAVWFWEDLVSAFESLEKGDRLKELAQGLKKLQRSFSKAHFGLKALAARWAILAMDRTEAEEWVGDVATQAFQGIDHETLGSRGSDRPLDRCYDAVAFCMGWANPSLSSLTISEDGVSSYSRHPSDDRRMPWLRRLLFVSASVGRLLKLCPDGEASDGAFSADELKTLLYISLERSQHFYAVGYQSFMAEHLRRLLVLTSSSGARHQRIICDALVSYASGAPFDQLTSVVWTALSERGLVEHLRAWIEEWLGPDGKVWTESLDVRIEVVNRFIGLSNHDDMGEILSLASERMKWGKVDYVTHKDYSLASPLRWLEAITGCEPATWMDFGIRLLAISDIASKRGDNRMSWAIRREVATTAATEGPAHLFALAEWSKATHREPFILAEDLVLDGIVGCAERSSLDDDVAVAFWCLAIGTSMAATQRRGRWLSQAKAALLKNSGPIRAPLLKRIARPEYKVASSIKPEADDAPQSNKPLIVTIEETLDDLEVQARTTKGSYTSGDLWTKYEEFCKALHETRPANTTRVLQRLLDILELWGDSPWEYFGIFKVVEQLSPLLNEGQFRRLLQISLDGIPLGDAPGTWLDSASERIRLICRLHSASSGDLRSGLEEEIAMHESWMWGPERRWAPHSIDPQVVDEIMDWFDVGISVLTEVLGTSCAGRIRSAIRGLWLIEERTGKVSAYTLDKWQSLTAAIRLWMLMIAERAVSTPALAPAWLSVIEYGLDDSDASVQLQSWVAARAFERTVGTALGVPLRAPAGAERRLIQPPGGALLSEGESKGLTVLSSGLSGLHALMRQLAAVTECDTAEIEQAFLADCQGRLPMKEPRAYDGCWEGDSVLTRHPACDMLVEWAVDKAVQGEWGESPWAGLAQALLTMDDTWLLTDGSEIASFEFPVDDKLDSLILGGELHQAFLDLVNTCIGDDEAVVGARLRSFSRKADAEMWLWMGWTSSQLVGKTARAPATFGGRTFGFFEDSVYEPSLGEYSGALLLRVGGLGWIPGCGHDFSPSRLLRRALGWEPDSNRPHVWSCQGGQVMWLERLFRPQRDIIQDIIYRQPSLTRWVCKKEALDLAENQLGVVFRTIHEVNVAPFNRSS